MKWYTNLKIRTKLLVGFMVMTFILIILVVVSLVSITTLERLSTELRNLHEERNSISGVLDAHYVWRQGITEAVLIGSEFKGSLDPNTCALGKWHGSDYAKNLTDPELLSKLKQVEEPHAFIHYEAKTIIKLIQDGNLHEAQNHLAKVIYPKTTEVISLLVDMRARYSDLVEMEDAESMRLSNFIIFLNIAFVIGAVIICIILALYISKVISVPIQFIEHKAVEIADTGDLRHGVAIDLKDEIGSLSNALTKMIANFETLVKKVIEEINHITKESEELSTISDVSANAAVELQAQTQTAASSSEQISANVSTVASSVEELSESIKEIAKNTTSATALTKESEEQANKASEVMDRLGQSSLEIGNIVKSITGIAEQTNLLALNATIEAARAGELGKGFAVVANEVKDLAKESAKATEDITNKIKAIQDDTNNAIEVIKGIIENSTKINDVTTSIASAVEEQSVTANEVNRNIAEATVGVNSIVEVISGIMKAVNEYSEQAKKVKNSSSTLKSLAVDLDEEIKTDFKV
jgi:methyl-accepting chemotaxis protein